MRLLDAGRRRFEQKKRCACKRTTSSKTLTLRPNIASADYAIKCAQVKRFLSDGHRVTLIVRFAGRELAHRQRGYELLARFGAEVAAFGASTRGPIQEGRTVSLSLTSHGVRLPAEKS
jgi:translation initiation factor IF-3